MTFTDPKWLEEERRCLKAIRGGEPYGLRRLYEVLAPPLYSRILLPQLGDPQTAQDVLAETFERAIAALDRYEDRGGSIWSWLVTIARNRARDVHRARAREGRQLASFEVLLAPLFGEEGDAGDTQLDRARLGEAVTKTLSRINLRYRRALELRFLEDRERVECAAAMEVKLGTFDVLLLRALRAFRTAWLDAHGAEKGPR